MSHQNGPLEDSSFEELFEDAPCGYLTTMLDGTILRVNRTLERWLGISRLQLVGKARFQDLLASGSRIYHETHLAPLLRMQGDVREIALELVRADGSRFPTFINSAIRVNDAGEGRSIATTVFGAVDRRRYEQELVDARDRERSVAHDLQEALLAGPVPRTPELDVETAYRPGVRDLEVGGDWHDAFWLTQPNTLALVVGDVVGKGIGAAAAMGQLRSATRAFALTSAGPAQVLEALDRYARRHQVGQLATLAYVQLSLTSLDLRYACAGHPPPVRLSHDQDPMLLWGGRSPPLAAAEGHPQARAEARFRLRPGDGLLLYTDGLVGRRSHPAEDGLQRLLCTIKALQHQPTAQMASNLLRALRDDLHPDDACLLAARLR